MTATAIDRTELMLLEERLRRAWARVDSASPGGPEFDAAMAAVEELEARCAAAQSRSRGEAIGATRTLRSLAPS